MNKYITVFACAISIILLLSGCGGYNDKHGDMAEKYMTETGRKNITLECYGYVLYYRGDKFFHELAYDENGNIIECDG